MFNSFMTVVFMCTTALWLLLIWGWGYVAAVERGDERKALAGLLTLLCVALSSLLISSCLRPGADSRKVTDVEVGAVLLSTFAVGCLCFIVTWKTAVGEAVVTLAGARPVLAVAAGGVLIVGLAAGVMSLLRLNARRRREYLDSLGSPSFRGRGRYYREFMEMIVAKYYFDGHAFIQRRTLEA